MSSVHPPKRRIEMEGGKVTATRKEKKIVKSKEKREKIRKEIINIVRIDVPMK